MMSQPDVNYDNILIIDVAIINNTANQSVRKSKKPFTSG